MMHRVSDEMWEKSAISLRLLPARLDCIVGKFDDFVAAVAVVVCVVFGPMVRAARGRHLAASGRGAT